MAQGRPEAPQQGLNELITAPATPPGRGAIGVVRLSGPGAGKAVSAFLRRSPRPDSPAPELRPRRATHCWAFDGPAPLDEIIAVLYPPESSYTGEEAVELSAHGSPYVMERLLALCQSAGARLAQPGEFTQRAYESGRLDLAQAEAVCELIAARTADAHRTAVGQLAGGLSREVAEIRRELIGLTAWVSALLDHPDEDLPRLNAAAVARLGGIIERIERLCSSHQRGRLALRGVRIAIVGRPNAGKSSLLNALLGSDRSIVAKRPGTTRDTVEAAVDLAGMEAILVDTAGLRKETGDTVEEEGMRRALRTLECAQLALVVVDRTGDPGDAESLLKEVRGRTDAPSIAVLNKCDLEPARIRPQALPEGLEPIEVSALRGDGVERLVSKMRRTLGAGAIGGDAVVVSERHHQALSRAGENLKAARRILAGGAGEELELAAVSLRRALDAVGEIAGRATSDEVLAAIFSRFCVGK